MGRGRLLRSPLLTLGSVQPPGVQCEWTLDHVAAGDREVAPGRRVELHAAVEATVADGAAVAFDIAAAGTRVARVQPPAASSRTLADGEDLAQACRAFAAEHPDDLTARLLIVRAPERNHLVTWWTVLAGVGQQLDFTLDAAGIAPGARTAEPLRVSGAAQGARAVSFVLRYEDDSPMGDAELEIAFAGGVRTRVRTGADGRAEVAIPTGAPEVFRAFLLSYVEREPGEEPPQPEPDPGPRPRPRPRPADTRPEVVAAFAFDSAFPGPAVHAALRRVCAKAGAAPDRRLLVFGHTDKVGAVDYNVALSERRARAVLALLLDDRDMFDAVATAEAWDTRAHQAMLWGLGCNPGAIDGTVGPMTRAAATSFQREHNEGVYHRLAVVARERPALAVDGQLSPQTRAAIRDAYVAVAPHVRAGRLADPQFAGCGKAHLVSDADHENRRAVVAFLPADVDLSQSVPCERYDELVGETAEDRRAPHFADHAWLREEDGKLHLSAATPIPDTSAATISVVRCEGPVPSPPPDSSGGGEPPNLGDVLAELDAEIRGGICFARWASPPADLLDPDTWLVDHDVQIHIAEPSDHDAPADGAPASGLSLLAADSVHPPLFIARSGSSWGVSTPPGARLNRITVADDVDDPDGPERGLALRSDGTLQVFFTDRGTAGLADAYEVVAIALADHDLTEGGAA